MRTVVRRGHLEHKQIRSLFFAKSNRTFSLWRGPVRRMFGRYEGYGLKNERHRPFRGPGRVRACQKIRYWERRLIIYSTDSREAIKNNHPNLVLSDITMPGVDGFELLREIRALGSNAGGSVPVIAMTALVAQADLARILKAGFQAYLPKPFTPNMLVERILTVLSD